VSCGTSIQALRAAAAAAASSTSWARRPSASEGDGGAPVRMASRKRAIS